jgi:hypothetical protein
MDEGRKRVLAIVAGILVARHLKTTEDLFDTKPSPKNQSPRRRLYLALNGSRFMEYGVSSKMHTGQIGKGSVQTFPSRLGEENAEFTTTISHSQTGHHLSGNVAARALNSSSTSRGRAGMRHNTTQCRRKELFNSAHCCTVAHHVG